MNMVIKTFRYFIDPSLIVCTLVFHYIMFVENDWKGIPPIHSPNFMYSWFINFFN